MALHPHQQQGLLGEAGNISYPYPQLQSQLGISSSLPQDLKNTAIQTRLSLQQRSPNAYHRHFSKPTFAIAIQGLELSTQFPSSPRYLPSLEHSPAAIGRHVTVPASHSLSSAPSVLWTQRSSPVPHPSITAGIHCFALHSPSLVSRAPLEPGLSPLQSFCQQSLARHIQDPTTLPAQPSEHPAGHAVPGHGADSQIDHRQPSIHNGPKLLPWRLPAKAPAVSRRRAAGAAWCRANASSAELYLILQHESHPLLLRLPGFFPNLGGFRISSITRCESPPTLLYLAAPRGCSPLEMVLMTPRGHFALPERGNQPRSKAAAFPDRSSPGRPAERQGGSRGHAELGCRGALLSLRPPRLCRAACPRVSRSPGDLDPSDTPRASHALEPRRGAPQPLSHARVVQGASRGS